VSEQLGAALVELLTPLVRGLVVDEVERQQVAQRWLPVSEAARRYDMSENTIRRRVARGTMPGVKVEGRVFVDAVAWERELEERLQ